MGTSEIPDRTGQSTKILGVKFDQKDLHNALFTGLSAAVIGQLMSLGFVDRYAGGLPRAAQFGLAGALAWPIGRILKKYAGF